MGDRVEGRKASFEEMEEEITGLKKRLTYMADKVLDFWTENKALRKELEEIRRGRKQ